MPDVSDGSMTVPLTLAQRFRLIVACLPVLFFVAATAAYLTILRSVYPLKPQLVVFLGVVLLVTGYYAWLALRDFLSGHAIVDEDVLVDIAGRGPHSHRHRRPRGTFARLGRLTLTLAAYHASERGRRHRIVYSPASRIVWTLEPLPPVE